MTTEFQLGRRLVGPQRPTYFIADIGANHDGSLERAVMLIALAAASGADAAKFQNFRAETIVSERGFSALGGQIAHQARWKSSVTEVYRKASLPLEWTETLKAACDEAGIDYLTSPYDLDQLEALAPHVCAWKVGSGDITWTELIERLSGDGKPVLIATGASELADVDRAVAASAAAGSRRVVMQCNTNYTGSADNLAYVELNVLRTYATRYPEVLLGLSDHTPGHLAVLGAVALGARVVEKHFTDDTTREGPDHPFSLDASTWRAMVDDVRRLQSALGGETKTVMGNERETVVVQRRALRCARDLPAGTVVGPDDLVALRPCPADALAPHQRSEVLGRTTRADLVAGDCIRLCDLSS